MEWQPTFGCSSSQGVSLIQLAVCDQVFLLDLCANGFCQHPDTISFIRSLFSLRNVLKLGEQQTWEGGRPFARRLLSVTFLLSSGYGMSGDLKCVLATWHQFLEEPLKTEGMVDLVNIHQKVTLYCHSDYFCN